MTSPAYMALAWARGDALPEPRVPSADDVRAWREDEGMTQTDAARVAGVSLVHYQRIETGRRAVPQWLADTLMQRWGSAP